MNVSKDMPRLSGGLTAILATAVGVLAANLYYSQPLAVPMAASFGLDLASAGLVVTLTQIGYGVGVLLLVPLGDLVENRRVILSMVALTAVSLVAVALSRDLRVYFASAFFLGVGASGIQVIVPYATHLAQPEMRGRVVGRLMSGLMLGIMLSRPVAGFLSAYSSWHLVYYFSASVILLIGIVLAVKLPRRAPNASGLRYRQVLASMGKLHFEYEVLRRRALYQASMFAAFCLFWTAAPILLSGPEFHLSQFGIAIFALVGVAGAVFAPIAGSLADRGLTSHTSAFSFAAASLAFLLTRAVPLGSTASLILLAVAAIFLDAGVSGNLVLGQRAIFGLPAELRGRLNSLFIATIFVGGALGSFIGAWAFARGQWPLTSWIGFALPTTGALYFATEWLGRGRASGV